MSKQIVRRSARGLGAVVCLASSAFVGLCSLLPRGYGLPGLLVSAGLGATGVVLVADAVAGDKNSNKEGEQ